MEISEFIGRTIPLFHRVGSRIPQRIDLKMLPMRNAGLTYKAHWDSICNRFPMRILGLREITFSNK